jgi:ubiquinone/menaquinone biosynthesis C-methylase UbiE
MSYWERKILPRVIDRTCGMAEIRPYRDEVVAGLAGDVVEIGFGSGLNMPHLPDTVERLYAVDPSELGQRLAAERIAASPVPVEVIGLDGQSLPLADRSVDAALSTFTLCTIPDVAAALAEVRRVLRPGGELHFLEHGLSPAPRTARWQHRLDGLQRRIAGGCHLVRPIDRVIIDAGFEVTSLRNALLKPATHGYLYLGVARAS